MSKREYFHQFHKVVTNSIMIILFLYRKIYIYQTMLLCMNHRIKGIRKIKIAEISPQFSIFCKIQGGYNVITLMETLRTKSAVLDESNFIIFCFQVVLQKKQVFMLAIRSSRQAITRPFHTVTNLHHNFFLCRSTA